MRFNSQIVAEWQDGRLSDPKETFAIVHEGRAASNVTFVAETRSAVLKPRRQAAWVTMLFLRSSFEDTTGTVSMVLATAISTISTRL